MSFRLYDSGIMDIAQAHSFRFERIRRFNGCCQACGSMIAQIILDQCMDARITGEIQGVKIMHRQGCNRKKKRLNFTTE